jgi:hypothetical protein
MSLGVLSLASLFKLVKCLRVRPEPKQVKPLSGAPLSVRSRPYPLTLDWDGKACQGQTHWLITEVKSLVTLGPVQIFLQHLKVSLEKIIY